MRICKKIYILVFLLTFVFNFNLKAEIVNKVNVVGNDRISLETIVVFADITIGKDYNETDVSLIIKKLYETNFFSEISAVLSNNTLNLTVSENPIVDVIIFNGEKAKKFKEKITEILTVKEKSSFISNNIKEDVNRIKNFYRSLGYYFVKIDAETEKLENNRVNIITQ